VGIWLTELPFHPGKLLRLLREKGKPREPIPPVEERISAAGESRA